MFGVGLIAGLVLLLVGAEALVRGGESVGIAIGISPLVVGLTIVAFATSSPELFVSLMAAVGGSTEMAIANVNGSNLANILLVLGAAACIRALPVEPSLRFREIPVLIGLQLVLLFLCRDHMINAPLEGLVLVSLGIAYTAWLIRDAWRDRKSVEPCETEEESRPALLLSITYVFLGAACLIIGSRFLVSGARECAEWLQISERYVGLTVLAIGTSAPELATSLVCVVRGQIQLAIGNAIGSNILNIVMVLGVVSLMMPIEFTSVDTITDLWFALGVAVLLVPIGFYGRINRPMGYGFLAAYIGYLYMAVAG